jgi:spore coat protein A
LRRIPDCSNGPICRRNCVASDRACPRDGKECHEENPIHLHLDPFQILARRPIRYEIPEGGIGERDLAATVTLARDPDDELDHAIDDNERGLKDTIRVNPNEIVEIAVRFTTYSGRYMYHCHILEHEDRDMMRPFVTMAPELMPFMA